MYEMGLGLFGLGLLLKCLRLDGFKCGQIWICGSIRSDWALIKPGLKSTRRTELVFRPYRGLGLRFLV